MGGRHALIPLLACGLACGTVKGMMSNVKGATLECAKCQPGMSVAVGIPLKLELDWKRCSSMDRNCDPSVPPFEVAIACDGAPCTTEDTGNGDYEVTPTAAGSSTIVVRLKDKNYREERIGPFTAVAMDGILLACTFIRPGGGRDQREACGETVPPNSDIYVEIVARAGDRRLANPVPRDVVIDGRVAYRSGQMVGGAGWECKPSIESSDPAVPTVTRCHKSAAPAGVTWKLEASVPGHHLSSAISIRVGKK